MLPRIAWAEQGGDDVSLRLLLHTTILPVLESARFVQSVPYLETPPILFYRVLRHSRTQTEAALAEHEGTSLSSFVQTDHGVASCAILHVCRVLFRSNQMLKQLAKIAISNNVGGVKFYLRTRLHTLGEERHFALVDALRFAI